MISGIYSSVAIFMNLSMEKVGSACLNNRITCACSVSSPNLEKKSRIRSIVGFSELLMDSLTDLAPLNKCELSLYADHFFSHLDLRLMIVYFFLLFDEG